MQIKFILGPYTGTSLYPAAIRSYLRSKKIKDNDSFFIYHAGTEKKDNKVLANGGRVLNFVSISDNFKSSRDIVIKEIENLNWDNGFYRRDIGYKIIDI